MINFIFVLLSNKYFALTHTIPIPIIPKFFFKWLYVARKTLLNNSKCDPSLKEKSKFPCSFDP